ncbi:hypothetical protein BKA56DRAFT_717933 [Ilyonectria sp. MPI-CAGE-AT-0026]|nr:hypothetical protein BKA56DRAFT_717933 [Ilyonectria sp. MPI-CAGE-AT-0026]
MQFLLCNSRLLAAQSRSRMSGYFHSDLRLSQHGLRNTGPRTPKRLAKAESKRSNRHAAMETLAGLEALELPRRQARTRAPEWSEPFHNHTKARPLGHPSRSQRMGISTLVLTTAVQRGGHQKLQVETILPIERAKAGLSVQARLP